MFLESSQPPHEAGQIPDQTQRFLKWSLGIFNEVCCCRLSHNNPLFLLVLRSTSLLLLLFSLLCDSYVELTRPKTLALLSTAVLLLFANFTTIKGGFLLPEEDAGYSCSETALLSSAPSSNPWLCVNTVPISGNIIFQEEVVGGDSVSRCKSGESYCWRCSKAEGRVMSYFVSAENGGE